MSKANEALDKMAENARELGLDYEPLAGTQVSKVWWDGEKLMAKPIPLKDFYEPAQQEPYGWIGNNSGAFIKNTGQKNVTGKPLYTSPPAQRTWVGLTDEELSKFDVDPVEAKLMIAKLKEKNT